MVQCERVRRHIVHASQPSSPIRDIAQSGHAPKPAEEEVVDPDNRRVRNGPDSEVHPPIRSECNIAGEVVAAGPEAVHQRRNLAIFVYSDDSPRKSPLRGVDRATPARYSCYRSPEPRRHLAYFAIAPKA